MGGLTVAQINILIKVRDDASRAMGKIGGAAAKMGKMVKTAAKIAAVGLIALGVASVKAAIDFESAFAGVRKTVTATEAEFDVLRQGIRDMAKELPASAVSIAAVSEAAGQLGIETKNILGFSRTMIDLGETTNLSATEAATALARLANITKLPQDQFDRLGSTIVDLGNNFATTEAEIVQMGLRLAGAGEQIGLTEAQILSMAAALTSLGINAEAGGTSFSRIMLDMSKAVATGNEDLATFAKVAGQSVEEFSRLFREDASEAIVAFMDGMSGLDQAALFGILEQLGFDNVRVRDAILRTAGSEGILTDALTLGTQAWKDNTALTEEAEQRYNTTAAQLSILRNNAVDLMITLGDALLPALRSINQALLDAMPAIEAFIKDGIEKATKAFKDWKPVIIDTGGAFKDFGNWVINNKPAIVAALIAIGLAFAWAFPVPTVIALGILGIVAAMMLMTRELERLGSSALKARRMILELNIALIEFMVTLSVLGLNKLPLVGNAFQQFGEIGIGAKVWLDDLKREVAAVDAQLAGLEREAAGNKFGELIAAQAGGAIMSLGTLNSAMIAVIHTGDLMAAQQAAFRVGIDPGLSGMELLRAVERASKIGAITTPPIVPPPPDPGPWEQFGSDAGAAIGGAIEKVLTERERWEAAGDAIADALASGLRGGTITMTEAVSTMFTFMDALPAKFSDIAATVGNVIGQFDAATAAAHDLFDAVAERGRVTFEDVARLVSLGAFDMAQDFLDAMEGKSSDIGAAIFEHIQEEAEEAAQEAADEFVEAFASARSEIESMFAGIAGSISGLVGGPSVESAAEDAQLAALRLEELEAQLVVMQEQAQAMAVIELLEKQIFFLRQQEAIEVERMTAEIEAQRAVIEGIEAQMDVVRAVVGSQIAQLDVKIDAAQANLSATKDAARAAIAEIDASLRVTRKETSALIKAAEAEAATARRAAESVIGDLERELAKLEADLANAVPESGARSIRDIMADIDKAGVIRRPALLRELGLAKQANLERQEQIAAEIEAQRDLIEEAERVAEIQIAAAEKQLAIAENAATALKEMWDGLIADAQAQVDDLKAERELLQDQLDAVLEMLEKQKEFAEADLATLRENLDAYTDSIDEQVEAIEEMIAAVEERNTVAQQNLQAIQDEIAELELLAKIRRLEREMAAATGLALNDRLLTDAEVLQAIQDEAEAFGQLSSAMDILNDGVLDVRDALVLAQLGFTDLAEIILNILAGIQTLPVGGLPLPEFGSGGIVPGPIGSPQIIRAHGGEPVLTPEQFKSLLAGGRGPVIVNVYPREINNYGSVRESMADLGAEWAMEAVNG